MIMRKTSTNHCRQMLLACLLFLAIGLAESPTVHADTIVLKNGKKIFGQIESEASSVIRFRSSIGTRDIDKADIESIERGPAPWDEFETIRKDYPETADGQYRLGVWCKSHGLRAEAKRQFELAIELDPNHDPSHVALGHDKGPDGWITKSKRSRPRLPAATQQTDEETPEEKLTRELITRWTVRVTDILRERLTNRAPDDPTFQRGRTQLLDIHDPLAIPGIANVLSRGELPVRLIMVDSLAQFRQDEATMNLIVIALFDPHHSVRDAATQALIPRKDSRVIDQLIKALSSDEDQVVRHASYALGVLKAREAVEPLATVLYTVERRRVRYRRTEIMNQVAQAYGPDENNIVYRGRIPISQRGGQQTGMLYDGTVTSTYWVDEVRDVKFWRTDVQEALIRITGQNFGFDPDAWMKWAQENP